MYAVNSSNQDLWVGDDDQGDSLVSSVSGNVKSDFETFADAMTAGAPSRASSLTNGKNTSVTQTPGVLRTGDASLMRNGQPTLPAERPFTIQVGWRLFRLSGASIMSDCKCSHDMSTKK